MKEFAQASCFRKTFRLAVVSAVVAASAAVAVGPAHAATPTENFIDAVYQDFFFREATDDEVTWFTAYLGDNSRYSMVRSVLEGDEFTNLWVIGVNQSLLGYYDSAAPDVQAELAAVRATKNFVQTELTVLASATYFDLAGNTNAGL